MTYLYFFSGISLSMDQVNPKSILRFDLSIIFHPFTVYSLSDTTSKFLRSLLLPDLFSIVCVQWKVLRDHVEQIDKAVNED